jgi:hypothetical protein
MDKLWSKWGNEWREWGNEWSSAKNFAELAVISNRQRLQRRENENRTIKNALWRSKQ